MSPHVIIVCAMLYTVFAIAPPYLPPWKPEAAWALMDSKLVRLISWSIKGSAAFDVTVTSPLNSSIVSEAGVTAGVAARAAERRKHEENDTKCTELVFPLL